MGSLSLLQGVFPTQGLNWGLLYYSWILYQLSYQGGLAKEQGERTPLQTPLRELQQPPVQDACGHYHQPPVAYYYFPLLLLLSRFSRVRLCATP